MSRCSFIACSIFAIFIGFVPVSSAETETVLTLDQALKEALARNPTLSVERTSVGIARGALRQARVYPFNPELELEGFAGRSSLDEGGSEGINGKGVGLSQVFLLRGQRGLGVQVAEAGLDRTEALVKDAERQVIGDVLLAFSNVLVGQERVALAQEVVALATDVREVAVNLAEAGEVPQLDVFRAEVALSEAENRLVTQERDLGVAQRDLALLLSRPTDQPIGGKGPMVLPLPEGDLASFQRTAIEGRPDLLAARADLQAAEVGLKLVRAERLFPALKVGFKYEEENEFDSVDRTGMLTFSLPLPLLNRRQGEVDQAMAERSRREAAIELIRLRIEKEVADTHQRVLASQQITESFTTKILAQQDRNFQLLREGYGLGQFSLTDVLVSQRELFETREVFLDTVETLNVATAELFRATGTRP